MINYIFYRIKKEIIATLCTMDIVDFLRKCPDSYTITRYGRTYLRPMEDEQCHK